MSDEEDIDENWSLPPRPLRPLPQVAKLTEERDRLRALLVKACVEIAADRQSHSSPGSEVGIIRDIAEQYGVRLWWSWWCWCWARGRARCRRIRRVRRGRLTCRFRRRG